MMFSGHQKYWRAKSWYFDSLGFFFQENQSKQSPYIVSAVTLHHWGPGRRGPSIPYPFNYFEKYPSFPKINMANIPKIQKALHPHIPKIDTSIPYPFKYLQKYPF